MCGTDRIVSTFIDPFCSFLVVIVITFTGNEDFTVFSPTKWLKESVLLRFLPRLVESAPSVCLNNIPTFPSSFVWISYFQRDFPPG